LGKQVFPTRRVVLVRTFPPRGKSAENPWQSRFSPTRAPPHRRHRFAATKICASCFATSLPQDLSAELMLESGGFGRRGLSRSLDLEILRRLVRRSRGASSWMPHKCLSGRRISRGSLGALPAVRLKRFKSYAFSWRPRAARARTAFGSPQRA
jgi:hypothetical protein